MRLLQWVGILVLSVWMTISIGLIVLSIGWVGSPWTRIFEIPEDPGDAAAFWSMWAVTVAPWLIALLVATRREKKSAAS